VKSAMLVLLSLCMFVVHWQIQRGVWDDRAATPTAIFFKVFLCNANYASNTSSKPL